MYDISHAPSPVVGGATVTYLFVDKDNPKITQRVHLSGIDYFVHADSIALLGAGLEMFYANMRLNHAWVYIVDDYDLTELKEL
ncbi:hypothetical protein [Lacticaseibacillus nasuensis]|uniref:hypothetical protein n=1 Tax=Lacticaseibacillus nasuensis TaxID=944671 RepID=UPI00224672E3|nr:hypothetical protein [Lacticaseibacillus nasuensis]MCX2454616.1 hypothetical protein [Lacticaseibacillus nasuensis]